MIPQLPLTLIQSFKTRWKYISLAATPWRGSSALNHVAPPASTGHPHKPDAVKSPLPDAPKQHTTFTTLQRLWVLLAPEHRRVQGALVALSMSSLVTLSLPRLMGLFVDAMDPTTGEGLPTSGPPESQTMGHAKKALVASALRIAEDQFLWIGGAIGLGALASGCRLYLLESASERMAFHLRLRLFESLIRKNLRELDKIQTGELLNRLSGDVTVTSRILHDVSFGIRNALSALFSILALFSFVPGQLVLSVLTPVVLSLFCGKAYGRHIKKLATKKQEQLALTTAIAEQRLSNIRTIKSFNGEALEISCFSAQLNRAARLAYKMSLAVASRAGCFYAIGGSLLLHLIYRCGKMVTAGLASMGDVTSLILYAAMAGGSLHGVMAAYGDIQKALGSCQAVLDLIYNHDTEQDARPSLATKPHDPLQPVSKLSSTDVSSFASSSQDVLTDSTTTALTSFCVHGQDRHDIVFDNVWFAYPSQPSIPILKAFSLALPEKAKVAIIGESGCGKSTLTALLLRLYPFQKGRILLGGTDIYSVPPAWVRNQIATAPQDSSLFPTTLRDNILYSTLADQYQSTIATAPFSHPRDNTSAASDTFRSKLLEPATLPSSLRTILDTTALSAFVDSLPHNLDTVVGEKGISLSGGQRQRISLARALAKPAPYYVLDEPTSAVDAVSELTIQKGLRNFLAASTAIIITHRLSLLRLCDFVAVMQNGKIAQFGETSSVLQSPCGILQHILHAQKSSYGLIL